MSMNDKHTFQTLTSQVIAMTRIFSSIQKKKSFFISVPTKNFSSLFCVIGNEKECLVNMFVLLCYEFLNFVTALSELVRKLHN